MIKEKFNKHFSTGANHTQAARCACPPVSLVSSTNQLPSVAKHPITDEHYSNTLCEPRHCAQELVQCIVSMLQNLAMLFDAAMDAIGPCFGKAIGRSDAPYAVSILQDGSVGGKSAH